MTTTLTRPTLRTVLGTLPARGGFTVARRLNPHAGNIGGFNGASAPLYIYEWGFDGATTVTEWDRAAVVRALQILGGR